MQKEIKGYQISEDGVKFVNLTPHTLNVVDRNGKVHNIEPSGLVARVETNKLNVGSTEGFNLMVETTGKVVDMPDSEWLTLYIVSRVVAAELKERTDVLVPGDFIRDEAGNILGCKGFSSLRNSVNFRKEV